MSDKGVRPRGPWVKLMANYFMDPALMDVGYRAELLYVRSLAMAKFIDEGGRLDRVHVDTISRGIYGVEGCISRLFARKLWRCDSKNGSIYITSWRKYNPDPEDEETFRTRDALRKREARAASKDVRADAVSARTPFKERKTGGRTPSVSVRPPGTAAPRGDAAQPSPGQKQNQDQEPDQNQDQDHGVRWTADEAKAEIRRKIQQAQTGNPQSTGRDIYLGRPEWKAAADESRRDHIGPNPHFDPNALGELLAKLPLNGHHGEDTEP